LLGPTDDFSLGDPRFGLDFEAEVCAVLGDTPRGTKAASAAPYVQLFMLANDWTFRNLVSPELAKGFGFFVSKPATAFSPFAVTADELGASYREGRLHLQLETRLNGQLCGDPDAGEMHFSFFDLIAHVTQTRALTAGTILGSGTVSNADPARGVSCLAELRARELIATGNATTPYLSAGDRVEIAMFDAARRNVFGSIEARVVA
jgi:fumarylacetoacetate (FAA) hydrolase